MNITFEDDSIEFVSPVITEAIVVVQVLSVSAIVSQLLIILISLGLEGNFSAKTFMGFQAGTEMMKRVVTIAVSFCGIIAGDDCLLVRSDISCKVLVSVKFIKDLLPDFISVVVAVDRLIATLFAVWYKEKSNSHKAWVVNVSVSTALLMMAVPNVFLVNLVPERSFCANKFWVFGKLQTALGMFAVVVGSALTLALIVAMKKVKTTATLTEKEKTVHKALTLNCVLFAVFSTVHYLLIGLNTDNQDQRTLFLAISTAASSFGVAIRGPIYLIMEPMRNALKRTLLGR